MVESEARLLMQSGVHCQLTYCFCWLPSALPEDPQRTVRTRVAVIPHPVVEEETMDAPWRGLWAQASTTTPCRARE